MLRSSVLVLAACGMLVFADSVCRAQPPGGPRQRGNPRAVFEVKTLPKDDVEKRILEVIEEVGRNQRAGNMIVPEEDGRLLRAWAEAVGAKHVVELGTSVGYSGLWFCLVLKKTGGKLTTFEINEKRAAMARENFEKAGVSDIVTIVLGDAHETVKQVKEPIDVLFLDADKTGYLDYFEKLSPLVRPGGVVIAHNMIPSMADPRFVKAITTNPDYETVFLHMDASGVSVSVKKH
ncbi:O-methyltransferase [Thermogutta terrifontis]|uniref:O-methyltransferase n=1 Tax=Thermogutta terrifontis TaxID=1331910 RepID=A0A286REB5_9BACT|nr:O-methyltransferase [Thermogutta terrifontis]ASV74296.1 O-methyltransferase [Thermogutta terrifontis]